MPSRSRPVVTWIDPQPVNPAEDLAAFCDHHDLLSEALARRGISSAGQAQSFLNPGYYTPSDPFDLPDMACAVERLSAAIHNGEPIGVWGDFDVDGQTSTSILVESLRALSAVVSYHIPVRARESHGINLPNLTPFLDSGVKVLLTCDTGITAHESIDYAQDRGVDVIITDHHTLPATLPAALAAVNPQRLPPEHPARTLSGSGTAYKLVEALARQFGNPQLARRQLDLAALGLVADLAILTGEARFIVQLGLDSLRNSARVGLMALYESAELKPDHLSEEHIGFLLAPRLNAVGRLDDSNPVVEFLTTTDLTRARIFARQLEGWNASRKLACDQVFKAAQSQLERDPALLDLPVLVLAQPHWPAGVIGIVASQLVELYHRPTVLISSPPGELARGSARSIEGINITEAIAACSNLLEGFGGHPMAAGLSLDASRIPVLRRALAAAVETQAEGRSLTRTIQIEAYVNLNQLDLDLVATLERMAPFGPGNPAPLLATRSLEITAVRPIGKEQEHLKLNVVDESGIQQEVIWWRGDTAGLPEGKFDLAYSAHASDFRGVPQVQMQWVNARVQPQPVISLTSPQIQVTDYRAISNPQTVLRELASQPDLMIWQEGENLSGLPGYDRTQLGLSTRLAIWSVPPGRIELQQALERVQPREVYLFGVFPAPDQPQPFLTRLGGLVQYAIRNKQGIIRLSQLGGLCGQRPVTVQKALLWLAARGHLTILESSGDECQLAAGGRVNEAMIKSVETELAFLLQETAAFRAYYLNAEAKTLVEIHDLSDF